MANTQLKSTAGFPAQQTSTTPSAELQQQVSALNRDQLLWLSGYCAARLELVGSSENATQLATVLPIAEQETVGPLTIAIIYASQTGNAKGIAKQLFQQLEENGYQAQLISSADIRPQQFIALDVALIIASTHGDGDPPDEAIDFVETIQGPRAPKFADKHHAVLALGDSSYDYFCQTGKDIDTAFTAIGSTPLVARVDCDLDYTASTSYWIAEVLAQLGRLDEQRSEQANGGVSQPVSHGSAPASEITASIDNSADAEVLAARPVTGAGSSRHVVHLELAVDESQITFEPGDALGVWVDNSRDCVDQVIELLALEAGEEVLIDDSSVSLLKALTEHRELCQISRPLFERVSSAVEETESIADYQDYIENHQVIDLLQLAVKARLEISAQTLVDELLPLKPRSYSIASDPQSYPGEVHLLVVRNRVESSNGEIRDGLASGYLTDRLTAGDSLKVFVQPNRSFRLPAPDKPLIMIGPGTGVAPFRAFIQARQAQAAPGKNWLFFGNPNFTTDFLYQLEWQRYLKDGVLNNIDLAFSRDQDHKIYVQDRIREQATQLWQWLEQGAHVYVCGDKSAMGRDVQQALLGVIQQQSGVDEQAASDYLKDLKKQGRYQRDLY